MYANYSARRESKDGESRSSVLSILSLHDEKVASVNAKDNFVDDKVVYRYGGSLVTEEETLMSDSNL